MNVSAVIVTRGNVDLDEIVASLPAEWEIVVWTNGQQVESRRPPGWTIQRGDMTYVFGDGPSLSIDAGTVDAGFPDLSVYGRYAAIAHATGDLIYVQDDDCVVENPQALVDQWKKSSLAAMGSFAPTPEQLNFIVANQPEAFRHDFYREHCLVGFGAVFHRDAPARAFNRFAKWMAARKDPVGIEAETGVFDRTCDVVFTALTPHVLVDVPYRNLPWATGDDRMYHQREHVAERARMLELALKVRDA